MGQVDVQSQLKALKRKKLAGALLAFVVFIAGMVYLNSPGAPAKAADAPAAVAAPAPAPAPAPAAPAPAPAPTAGDQPAAAAATPAPAPAPAPELTPDPNGAATGSSADVAKKGDTLTLDDVATQAGKNKISINFVWTLICGFLVIFMQAGFAMVETGLTRAKNVSHTMAMNFLIYPIGMLGFYLCGFALMWGGQTNATLGGYTLGSEYSISVAGHDWGLFGTKGFLLLDSKVYDVSMYAIFLFQMAFMDTTCTIPTGALAERWKFSAFALFSCFIGTIIYPIYGNWVWGGGWLSHLGDIGLGVGHVDFAGSSVVHMTGGVIALVGGYLIGPRLGKYNKDGSANIIPAHSVPMVIIGTFILAFGWFGFNPGSTLAGSDYRMAVVATNTMLASATGALMATLWVWKVRGNKPDPTMMCNGMLAGLVAITGPCGYVSAGGASIIGLISGVLVVEAVLFIDRKLRIDDPVGAISVHGVNGAWGILSIGLFADGTYAGVEGLFYGKHQWGQLGAECIGILANLIWVGGTAFVFYKLIDVLVGHRVKAEDEVEGLDIPEMGVPGYVGVVMDKAAETPESR
ncbi:MAG TPA: ammonium transporter [Planctomycetota bacterium]|nr:ammonium transporter [Planctomycetota bacterium]